MNWTSVIEGVVTGTATAVTWVLLLALANLLRNVLLERKIRGSFQNVGYSFGENSFGIVLHNTTDFPVNVWRVAFSFPNGGYAPLYFSGEKIASSTHFLTETNNGHVELGFDIQGIWNIDKERMIKISPVPIGAFCVIEYGTLINTKKRITVKISKVSEFQDAFQRCRGRWVMNEKG